MKSNSRSYPASFRALTIPNNRNIISLIISISVRLYALYGLRGSVGVLRVHRCKYSHVIAFNLCALKFCNHARTDQQERHPEKCARIPSPEHGERSGHQTGAAVYPVLVQYAGDPQKISANDQHAPGQVPE